MTGKMVLARISGVSALAGLLLAVGLMLSVEEPRWATTALAASAALSGLFALLEVSARSTVAKESRAQAAARSADDDLPVDPTTGLYRPWIFHRRLAEEVARAARYRHEFAVVMLEPVNLLDKPAPGPYGQAARALRRAIRTCDFAAQFDDLRFAVLLPETEKVGARTAGRRLLSTLQTSSEPTSGWRGALVSYPADGDQPSALLNRANIALRRSRVKKP